LSWKCADLKSLDDAARSAAAALGDTPIIVTHPRYQYFARAYRLDIHSLEWEAGAAPTEAQWDELAALSAETDAKILVWEAEPPAAARERAKAMGMRDIILPVLSNKPGAGDFLSAMRSGLADMAGLAGRD